MTNSASKEKNHAVGMVKEQFFGAPFSEALQKGVTERAARLQETSLFKLLDPSWWDQNVFGKLLGNTKQTVSGFLKSPLKVIQKIPEIIPFVSGRNGGGTNAVFRAAQSVSSSVSSVTSSVSDRAAELQAGFEASGFFKGIQENLSK